MEISPLNVYDSWKLFYLVWLNQEELLFWVFILSTYGIDEVSEWVDIALKMFELDSKDLFLSLFILTFSKKILASTELNIAERLKEKFIFTISLLCTIIQDGGISEKSMLWQLLDTKSNNHTSK